MDPLYEQFPAWNPYHYVHNNPINLVDPTGMAAEEVIINGQKIEYKPDPKTNEMTWSSNTPEEFKEVANAMLETKIGSENLMEALNSKVKMNVEFSNESKIDDGATFGLNTPIKLSTDGKTILESKITIYKGTIDDLNLKYGDGWEVTRPDNGGVIHSGKISKTQNMAGTLGHEFIHSMYKQSSSELSPNRTETQIESQPRTFSEIFYFQTTNKKN